MDHRNIRYLFVRGSMRVSKRLCIALFFVSAAMTIAEVTFEHPFGISVRPDGSFMAADFGTAGILKFDRNGAFVGQLRTIDGYGDLVGPFDVAVGNNGKIYIADTLGHAVIALDAQENLLFVLGDGTPSAKQGHFHEPHRIAIDTVRRRLYVADSHNQRIQVFDENGTFLAAAGKAGIYNEPGSFDFSVGLDIDSSGNLYVMSLYGGQIHVFNPDLEFVKTIGRQGYVPGEFHAAYGIRIHNDTLWVADTRNSRLQQLTLSGAPLRVIGGNEGSASNQLNNPSDMDIDADGNLYITDWRNKRILKLDCNGDFLDQWGTSDIVMDFSPPQVIKRSQTADPVRLGIYGGINKEQIDAAAQAGAEWIYVSLGYDDQKGIINLPEQSWDIKEHVAYAQRRGLKVAPYISVFQMGAGLSQWRARPELYMQKKGSDKPMGHALSYYWPEVRTWRVRHIVEQVKETGVDGLMLDYIRYPDQFCGYEPILVDAYRGKTGRDVRDLPPNDKDWLMFRAGYITTFIRQLRQELNKLEKPVILSAFVGPDPDRDLHHVVRYWPDWVKEGLIDMICIGEYSRHFSDFYNSVITARENSPQPIRISIVIACWGGNLNNRNLLMKGAEVALAAGPDEIALYRGDAIELLDLWDAIADVSEMLKKHVTSN